jgi:hypothetical protein
LNIIDSAISPALYQNIDNLPIFNSTVHASIANMLMISKNRIITNNPIKLETKISYRAMISNFNEMLIKQLQCNLSFQLIDTIMNQDVWVLSFNDISKVKKISRGKYTGGGLMPENYTYGNDEECFSCSLAQMALTIEQETNNIIIPDTTVSFSYYDKFKIPFKLLKSDINDLNSWLKENTGFYFYKKKEKVPYVYVKFYE